MSLFSPRLSRRRAVSRVADNSEYLPISLTGMDIARECVRLNVESFASPSQLSSPGLTRRSRGPAERLACRVKPGNDTEGDHGGSRWTWAPSLVLSRRLISGAAYRRPQRNRPKADCRERSPLPAIACVVGRGFIAPIEVCAGRRRSSLRKSSRLSIRPREPNPAGHGVDRLLSTVRLMNACWLWPPRPILQNHLAGIGPRIRPRFQQVRRNKCKMHMVEFKFRICRRPPIARAGSALPSSAGGRG
jgi:hypothetical protein